VSSLGVVIVCFNSEQFISDCIKTLQASTQQVTLHIVIVDNASTDATTTVIETLNEPLTLIRSEHNLGFAAAVNIGLRHLLANKSLNDFWLLNPDTKVAKHTPDAFARDTGAYSMKSGRILYDTEPNSIQIDGGRVNGWTGVTSNLNLGLCPCETPLPKPSDLHFVSGASLVVSRDFVEQVGMMPEEYFLYYEEVDWAARSTRLPMQVVDQAVVCHAAGASIGSPTLEQSGSAFSEYFKNRSRLKYMRKYHRAKLPIALLYGWARAIRFLLRRQNAQAIAVLRGQHGLMPSSTITDKLTSSTLAIINRYSDSHLAKARSSESSAS